MGIWKLALATLVACLLFTSVACGVVHSVEQEGKDIGADIGTEFEWACSSFGWTCGQVFECQLPVPYGGPTGTSHPELCWLDDSARELAAALTEQYGETTCAPTSRGGALGWPCHYQCPSAHGCNAYEGCFCP